MKFFTMLVITVAALTANADDSSTGCGLGWKVTKSYTFSATTTRGTTNSYTTPFGMTFGTAGCQKHTIAQKEVQLRNFARISYDSISIDASMGGGEHLAAMTELLGCDASVRGHVGLKIQSQYQQLFPAQGSSDKMVDQVISIIGSDSQLSRTCQLDT